MKQLLLSAILMFAHYAAGANSYQRFYIITDEFDFPHIIDLEKPPRDLTVNKSDITFHMFTRNNLMEPIIIHPENFTGVIPKHFNPNHSNYFLTHGYTDSAHGKGINKLKTTLLETEDINVFIMDYYTISHEFYTTAVGSVNQVGKIMGETISKIMATYNVPPAKINMQGHSLGTHVVGAIGAHLNGNVNLIVATDPAMPLFDHDDLNQRLDTTDAQFVQIIHTNGGLLGFKRAIGHADYYPNGGGINQPGCGADLVGVCSHNRAPYFFIESIASSGFRAKACDSYVDYKAGLCNGNEDSYLGEFLVDRKAHGTYYLETAAESPFALG